LPEDEAFRLELGEGVLSIMPTPLSWHQKAATRLGYRLDEELPTELTSVYDVEVVLADDFLTIRVPDVVVTTTARYEQDPPRHRASEIMIAVEILSDGSRRIDRVLTFSEYAEAGIPQYWIVDVAEPTTLLAYALVDGAYELSRR
jgi:Uma2 family endonuclease